LSSWASAGQQLQVNRGGREQRLDLHLASASELSARQAVFRLCVGVDSLPDYAPSDHETPGATRQQTSLQLLHQLGALISEDLAVTASGRTLRF
jgi:hypothetical protein